MVHYVLLLKCILCLFPVLFRVTHEFHCARLQQSHQRSNKAIQYNARAKPIWRKDLERCVCFRQASLLLGLEDYAVYTSRNTKKNMRGIVS